MVARIVDGLLSGAAGTAALNMTTYVDIAARGRPPSDLPERAVEELARRAGVSLGSRRRARHRKTGLGSLGGFATGLAIGVAYGLTRPLARRVPLPAAAVALGIAATAATHSGNWRLGLTDPREWSASEWAEDLVPHLAYGAVATVAYERLARRGGEPPPAEFSRATP